MNLDKQNKKLRRERMEAARKKGTHTKEQWQALLIEADSICVRCLKYTPNLAKDHIIPVYQGGSDGIDNLQPICHHCNASKGPENFNWLEYRRQQRKATNG